MDYQNRVCGKSAGVEDKPYAAWPWILPYPSGQNASYYKSIFEIKVCLSSCNDTATNSSASGIAFAYKSKKGMNFNFFEKGY